MVQTIHYTLSSKRTLQNDYSLNELFHEDPEALMLSTLDITTTQEDIDKYEKNLKKYLDN